MPAYFDPKVSTWYAKCLSSPTLNTPNPAVLVQQRQPLYSEVLPRSSASDLECWAEASAHKPPSSSPPLRDRTAPGHSTAAGSPHECLTGKRYMRHVNECVLGASNKNKHSDKSSFSRVGGVTVIM